MDAVTLRLVLGRASGLRYQQLRSAVEKISPRQADIGAVQALIGASSDTLQSLGLGRAASAWLQAPDAAALAADREWIARERDRIARCLRSALPAAAAAAQQRARAAVCARRYRLPEPAAACHRRHAQPHAAGRACRPCSLPRSCARRAHDHQRTRARHRRRRSRGRAARGRPNRGGARLGSGQNLSARSTDSWPPASRLAAR